MKDLKSAFKELGFSYDKNMLNDSYKEALKDTTFKEIVDGLSISKEELIKRTSTIMECSYELSNCKKCKCLLDCKNKLNGYCYLPMIYNDDLVFNYQACKYKKEFDDNVKYQENIYLFDIPREIKEARIENIYVDDEKRLPIIKWINSFIKNYDENKKSKGLYLSGNFGCGKTYMIAALFNEMAKRGVKVAIIYFPEYLRDLKGSFESDYEQKYEHIKKVPLLLIDDIGAENLSSWGRDEILGTILQYRMQEGKTTFFTSNLNLSELEQHLSVTKSGADDVKARRIMDRIKYLTENIEFIGKNLRG